MKIELRRKTGDATVVTDGTGLESTVILLRDVVGMTVDGTVGRGALGTVLGVPTDEKADGDTEGVLTVSERVPSVLTLIVVTKTLG